MGGSVAGSVAGNSNGNSSNMQAAGGANQNLDGTTKVDETIL